eukprot:1157013-Pelagomonas_calceolata.AAC.5
MQHSQSQAVWREGPCPHCEQAPSTSSTQHSHSIGTLALRSMPQQRSSTQHFQHTALTYPGSVALRSMPTTRPNALAPRVSVFKPAGEDRLCVAKCTLWWMMKPVCCACRISVSATPLDRSSAFSPTTTSALFSTLTRVCTLLAALPGIMTDASICHTTVSRALSPPTTSAAFSSSLLSRPLPLRIRPPPTPALPPLLPTLPAPPPVPLTTPAASMIPACKRAAAAAACSSLAAAHHASGVNDTCMDSVTFT